MEGKGKMSVEKKEKKETDSSEWTNSKERGEVGDRERETQKSDENVKASQPTSGFARNQ